MVVNDSVYGLLYKSDVKTPIRIGKRLDGYIIKIREDGKLDVSLQEPGLLGIEHAASLLLRIQILRILRITCICQKASLKKLLAISIN